MSIADYGAENWIGVMFGVVTLPASFYIALLTDEPGDGWDGSVVASLEPSDSAYARQPVAVGSGWTLSDGGFVINASTITFPTPTEDWGQIPYYALLDAETNGNLWSYGLFLEPLYVSTGYAPALATASIYHSLSDQLASIAN